MSACITMYRSRDVDARNESTLSRRQGINATKYHAAIYKATILPKYSFNHPSSPNTPHLFLPHFLSPHTTNSKSLKSSLSWGFLLRVFVVCLSFGIKLVRISAVEIFFRRDGKDPSALWKCQRAEWRLKNSMGFWHGRREWGWFRYYCGCEEILFLEHHSLGTWRGMARWVFLWIDDEGGN